MDIMNRCPCKECICLPVCKGRKICRLLRKCDTILDYIQDMNSVMKTIEIISPPYADKPDTIIQFNAGIVMKKAQVMKI